MENKVALITGASRGIGKAIALKLASEGYAVVINYNGSLARANEVSSECEKYGVPVKVIQANVSDFKEVANMVEEIMGSWGRIDCLVNNAGITRDNLLLRMSEEEFDAVVATNLKGSFNCIKHVSKVMLKQKSGVIINMSSVIGLIGNVGQINYAASKAGVLGLTKATARELGSRNIRCNAVAPGFINTEMTEELNVDIKNKILEQIPLKKFAEASDVANVVSFLASDLAAYITGQVINVDGGMVM